MKEGKNRLTLPHDIQYAFQQRLARLAVFQPRMRELRARLVQEGGQEVNFEHLEPDIDALIDEGWIFTYRVRSYPGKYAACHQNVAKAWKENPTHFRIATGYALNQYGVWIQHSWLVDSDLIIYETAGTVFDLYYGIVYTKEQAQRFMRDVLR